MKRNKALFGVLLLVVMLTGIACASFVKTSAVILDTGASAYDNGMKAVRDLQDKGFINDEQRAKINDVARIYRASLLVAIDTLATYKLTKSADDKNKAFVAIGEAVSHWADLAKLVNSIRPGTLPETIIIK